MELRPGTCLLVRVHIGSHLDDCRSDKISVWVLGNGPAATVKKDLAALLLY